MRILIVGSGGREHALAWALAAHGHQIVCAPGNPGMAKLAECVAVGVDDLDGLAKLAAARAVDLVVVGPEAPLVAGLVDRIEGIPCFGPRSDGARMEGSKAWSKEFFRRHGIPTADFDVCRDMAAVDAALARLGGDVVVKADGLAAGKGVVVCHSATHAREAARRMIEERLFGDAGTTVVIERRLPGREASILAITDGTRLLILPAAEDHKTVHDGDRGPNTGGMGVVSPTPVVDDNLLARARREVFEPTLAGLRAEGIDYRGVLYAGLMIAPDGTPNLLEYNCRFGDPETEAIFARVDEDPARWLLGAARGALPAGDLRVSPKTAVCVILAAAGYPQDPRKGDEITINIREPAPGENPPTRAGSRGGATDALVFHAGTRRDGDRLLTAGGRVLAVTATGADLAEARSNAYAAIGEIHFEGMHYRRDIGARGSTGGT